MQRLNNYIVIILDLAHGQIFGFGAWDIFCFGGGGLSSFYYGIVHICACKIEYIAHAMFFKNVYSHSDVIFVKY